MMPILDLNKAIAIDEDKSDYYRALGTIYYNEKEYDKAIENIRKSIFRLMKKMF